MGPLCFSCLGFLQLSYDFIIIVIIQHVRTHHSMVKAYKKARHLIIITFLSLSIDTIPALFFFFQLIKLHWLILYMFFFQEHLWLGMLCSVTGVYHHSLGGYLPTHRVCGKASHSHHGYHSYPHLVKAAQERKGFLNSGWVTRAFSTLGECNKGFLISGWV